MKDTNRWYVVNKVGHTWNLYSAPSKTEAFKFKKLVERDLGKKYVKDVVRGQNQAFIVRDIARQEDRNQTRRSKGRIR
jgi:hypothetical protein